MSIFTSKHSLFTDLLQRIEKILNLQRPGLNLTQERMRPWKFAYNADLDKVDLEIKKAIASTMDVDGDNSTSHESEGSKIEQNTGVRFPGVSLEMMRKFDVDDIELSSNDTLVIET